MISPRRRDKPASGCKPIELGTPRSPRVLLTAIAIAEKGHHAAIASPCEAGAFAGIGLRRGGRGGRARAGVLQRLSWRQRFTGRRFRPRERPARMAPTLPRAPRQFNERVGRVALRLLKGFLLVLDFFLELLDARVGGEILGHRTVIAVDLLDAVAVGAADRRAGGVVSLLGRADDAVELECVVRLSAPGADPAKIGLVGVFTGNAIRCIGQ